MSEKGDLRLVAGMVGGGDGADIGKTHRHAMRLDDQYVLAAGVFGAERRGVGPDGGDVSAYPPTASTATTCEMAEQRVDAAPTASTSSPWPPRTTAISRSPARSCITGISVVCEKPLTRSSATAAELVEIAESSGAILAVPHCYSAYAMVRHAARMVRDGELGAIRFVAVEHASGWAATPLELTGHKQASWRTNPEIAG